MVPMTMKNHDTSPLPSAVDVLVIGGGVRAVAAAVAASRTGQSVLIAAPRLYLGDDLVGTLQLAVREGESREGELTSAIFANGSPATPLRVKQTLEAAVLKHGIEVRLGCLPVGARTAPDAHVSTVLLATRGGVAGVHCRTVVDATDTALVAEFAGALLTPRRPPPPRPRRVVLAENNANRRGAVRAVVCDVNHVYLEYELDLDIAEDTLPAVARAEQVARDRTEGPGVVRGAERMTRLPNRVLADPSSIPGLFVLGPAAEADTDRALDLLRPAPSEAIGRHVGNRAAQFARSRPRVGEGEAAGVDLADPAFAPSSLPALGHWDVLVAGGGTSGACAAIGAARRGARVLVTEFQEGLGGIGTLGLIGKPYHGLSRGFAREVPFPSHGVSVEAKMEWYREQIRSAGGEIWFGALAFEPTLDGNRANGVAIASPDACGLAMAEIVVDATGNADLAIAAGAQWTYGGPLDDLALQGVGFSARDAATTPTNSDCLLVDEGDPADVTRAFLGARQAMDPNAFDSIPLLQTRERRMVVGEHTLNYLDQIAGRTYADSIVLSASDYDSHGYPSLTFFAMLPHDQASKTANHPAPGGECTTPYRCLLPKGLEGLLVTGLGISMQRDAAALVRMQHDLANQGYAAGVAAATLAKNACGVRNLDVRALQRHLVDIGNLPPDVLEHEGHDPSGECELRNAVEQLGRATNPADAGRPLAFVLSHADRANPFLVRAFENAKGETRTLFARVLGFLGDKRAVPVLIDALRDVKQWDPKILQGRMAEYAHLPTPVDSLVMALGWTGDARAVPEILRLLDLLHAETTLSHHRAIALALERIRDQRACVPLANLLAKPGMRGHALTEIVPLPDFPAEQRRRLGPLREIVLARALLRCGDRNGLGREILEAYTRDLRPLFHRHARHVLATSA